MSAETKKRDLIITRVFDVPVEQVWNAWSNSDQVMRWWGPTGFTCPVAKMDFREGGTSLVCMRAPKEFGGQDMYSTWTYQKIVPMQQIDFIQNFADENANQIDPITLGLPPDMPQKVRSLVIFKAIGNNRTEINITEFGYTSDQIIELSKAGMEQCLDKMAASFTEV
ncbi:MAG: SRPBCC domain-containing protein [Anaerolineae bacterium]|nr:SRPBCC domain-containing protein [Anaerolineae bacterium]